MARQRQDLRRELDRYYDTAQTDSGTSKALRAILGGDKLFASAVEAREELLGGCGSA